jgi:hypothetical protein
MTPLTRQQREALKRVYDRQPLYLHIDPCLPHLPRVDSAPNAHPVTYRQFRRRLQVGGCVPMIYWCGMWLGIEPDGYTHS